MAYNFRPSRPKAAVNPKRLVKRESVFQVERGPISNQKRDVKQLDEFRNRSFIQRGCNKFRTTSQRSGLTVGEQEIEKRSNKQDFSINSGNQTFCSVQTLPSVDKDVLAAKFTPRCFEYVQNYHHYILDLNKLEKGEQVPYLSRMEKQNTFNLSKTGGRTTKEGCQTQSWSKSNPSNYFSGLPRRDPKSASRSRRGSAGNTTKMEHNFMINPFPSTHAPRNEEDRSKRIVTQPEDVKDTENDTLQDLIISEIEGEHEESRAKDSNSEFTDLHVDSIYQVSNSSTTDLRVPSGTPVTTPRSSTVHNSFPNLPNTWSSDLKTNGLQGISSEVRRPYLAAFTTRIPPLKAPDNCLNEERRRQRNTFIPDYQRYRILCDAFRPISPQGGRGRRPIDRHRPNFVTSEELDYYIDVVNNINAVDEYYSY